jgi:hypothetical protein
MNCVLNSILLYFVFLLNRKPCKFKALNRSVFSIIYTCIKRELGNNSRKSNSEIIHEQKIYIKTKKINQYIREKK